MAIFRYAPTRYLSTQGVTNPNFPIAVSTQGVLVPVGLFQQGGDINLGGCASITTSLAGVSQYCYFPSFVDTVNVQGDGLITVTSGGLLCVDYKVPPYGVTLGGAARIGSPGEVIGDGGLVTGGDVPITVTLGGVTEFCYPPSALDAVTLDGDALVIARQDGVLCADYKVPPYGIELGGEAHVTVTLDGVTQFCYFPGVGEDGNNIVCGGEAGVDATLQDGQRGGKGTPIFRRRYQGQRTIHFYDAHAFFDSTLQIGGESEATYREAPYKFIKSLPSVPKPNPKRDSEFVDLFKKKLSEPQTTKFAYSAEGGITAHGQAKEEYFDFRNFIITHDEDLIITDLLSSDGFPIISTSFDNRLAKQQRDEDELFQILDIL